MKRIAFLIISICLSCSALAQDAVFEKYGKNPHVETTFISKTMFKMVAKAAKGEKGSRIIDRIEQLRTMECLHGATAAAIARDVEDAMKRCKAELLMENRDEGEQNSIYQFKENGKNNILIVTLESSSTVSVGNREVTVSKEQWESVMGKNHAEFKPNSNTVSEINVVCITGDINLEDIGEIMRETKHGF